MKTTNFSRAWAFALLVPCACELPPDLLEAGSLGDSTDEGTAHDDGTDDDGGTSETGDPELEDPECVVQGTNPSGEPEPDDFDFPECDVTCAEGWGHDVPLLESEWTEEPNSLNGEEPTRGAVGISADDRPLMVFSGPNLNHQLHALSPEGEYESSVSASWVAGEVLDFDTDPDLPYYYFVWTDGTNQQLTASHDDGWWFDMELGPHALGSSLAAVEGGVVIALQGEQPRLLHIDKTGTILLDQPIGEVSKIDVSPSGDVIALASPKMLGLANMQGAYLGGHAIDGVSEVRGLIAIDDTHVVFAGGESDQAGDLRASLRAFNAMGPSWARSYDRASAWCNEGTTEELFTAVDQLGDGTLIVVGVETIGHGFPSEGINTPTQPWVAHVSADGEVLAYDRGFWQGSALDVVARDDVAYVLLTEEGWVGGIGEPYIRKYAF